MMMRMYTWLALMLAMTAALASEPHANDSLKQVLQRQLPDSARIRVLSALASNLRHSGTGEALEYAHEALSLAQKLNEPKGKASVLQILGLIYTTRADYRNALFYSLQALRIYESLKIDDGTGYAYNAIGNIYHRLKKYDLAESYFKRALPIFYRLRLDHAITMIYCNIGNVYSGRNDIPQSIFYYQKGLENSRLRGDKKAVAGLLVNIGEVYSELGNTDSALVYFTEAQEISLEVKDEYALAHVYYDLGKLWLSLGNSGRAASYQLLAEELSVKGDMSDLLTDVYKAQQAVYSRKGDYKKAFAYAQLHAQLKDSVYNETTVNQINDIQKVYEVEKRDKEIRLLNQQQQIVEANLSNQRLIRNFMLSGLLFVIVTGIVVARNVVLKQRMKNQELSRLNAVAEKNIAKLNHENALAKYEAMKSKTDPHFLFNSLTTLSSLVVEDPKLAVKYIKRFAHLFRMVLEIGDHKLITLEKEMEIVNSYIYLQKIRFEDDLDVHISLPQETMFLLVPPFAIQMVVENAIKHNIISGTLPLSLSLHAGNEYIVVRNNLQKKTSKVPSTSTGQKNVAERYRMLSNTRPDFTETSAEYIVRLPLLRQENTLTFRAYEPA